MTVRIAIQGFGRIGRCVLRNLHAQAESSKRVVAICDDMRLDEAAHLLKFDSIYGTYPNSIDIDDRHLIVDGRAINFVHDAANGALSAARQADVVIDTQRANDRARCVVLTGRASDATDDRAAGAANRAILVNMSSEACFAALVGVLTRRFEFTAAIVTSVHSYTAGQGGLDGVTGDLRKGRAAPISMIPYPLRGIAQLGDVHAGFTGKVAGVGLSVPVQRVSLMEVVFATAYDLSREDVNLAFSEAAMSARDVLGYSNDPLVSIDFAGRREDAVFDAQQTLVAGKRLVRIAAWFDDEFALASRIIRGIDRLDIETQP